WFSIGPGSTFTAPAPGAVTSGAGEQVRGTALTPVVRGPSGTEGPAEPGSRRVDPGAVLGGGADLGDHEMAALGGIGRDLEDDLLREALPVPELAVAAADMVRGRDAFLGVQGAVLGDVLQPRPHIGAEAARAPIARLEGDHEVPITLARWVVVPVGLGDEVADLPADLTEARLGALAARAPIACLAGDHEVPITLGRCVVEQVGLGDEVVDIPADLPEGDLEMARRIGGVEGDGGALGLGLLGAGGDLRPLALT